MFNLNSYIPALKPEYVVTLNNRDVTQFVTSSLSLEHSVNRLYKKLSLGFTQQDTVRLNINPGQKVGLFFKNRLIFEGIIFDASFADNWTTSVTAYDAGVYYAKNLVNKSFVNTTAGTMVKTVTKDVGMAVGEIANTGYIIPEYEMADKSLQDIAFDTLDITYEQTGKRFYALLIDGALSIVPYVKPPQAVVIEEGRNMIAVSKEVTINDLANYVVVRGGNKDNPTTSIAKDDASIAKYGKMMKVDSVDEEAEPSHARDRAQSILNESKAPKRKVSASALGDFNVMAASHVYLRESRTYVSGEYVVESVTHNIDMTTHTMSLTLREA